MADNVLSNFSDLVARVDDLDKDATGLRNCLITFLGNVITEMEESGKKIVTTLNINGSITEQFYSETGILLKTKTTVRLPNGSIQETVV